MQTDERVKLMIRELLSAQREVLTQTEKDMYSAKIKALYWVLGETMDDDLLDNDTYK